jgi:hypothetical protein
MDRISELTPFEDVVALLYSFIGEALPDLGEVLLFDVITLPEELNILHQRQKSLLKILF